MGLQACLSLYPAEQIWVLAHHARLCAGLGRSSTVVSSGAT